MSTAVVTRPVAGISPQRWARIAGIFYVFNIITAFYAFYGSKRGLAFALGLVATACYVAVTVIFYYLFKPVNPIVSLVAALFSLAGSTVGVLDSVHINIVPINILVFFGFYCLLIGFLILRSTFLPWILGVLMGIAGLGWLTFVSSSFAKSLNPYNLIPGIVGEGLLTLWLVACGVNSEHWKEQAAQA